MILYQNFALEIPTITAFCRKLSHLENSYHFLFKIIIKTGILRPKNTAFDRNSAFIWLTFPYNFLPKVAFFAYPKMITPQIKLCYSVKWGNEVFTLKIFTLLQQINPILLKPTKGKQKVRDSVLRYFFYFLFNFSPFKPKIVLDCI